MNEPSTLQPWLDGLEQFGERPAVVALRKQGRRQTSYRELDALSRRFAAGLSQRQLQAGDRVVLLGKSEPAWIAACLGAMRAGVTPVPVDVQFEDETLAHVLEDSRPRFVLADRRQAERLERLNLDVEGQPEILLLDEDEGDRSWRRLLADSPGELPAAEPSDNVVLFYTSGTTGPPKGVPLTHENIAVQIDVLLNADLVGDQDRVLLPLPLHHVYPFVVGMLSPLARGLPIVFPYSLTGPQLMRALRDMDITILIGVPRLYRALYDGVEANVESSGRVARSVFQGALALSRTLRKKFGVRAGKWLLRSLHRRFGPSLRVLACGGSALDEDLAWNLESLGWQVAVGYGLTETSPLLTLNLPGQGKIGSVGQVIPAVELRIETEQAEGTGKEGGAEVGEIVARGPSVFQGYRNLPEKTREAFSEDGWFHTGDLGFLDEGGFLHVTGRMGTMIVTEGGENVQPDEVEAAYAAQPVIREIGVLEEERRLVALIVPETAEVDGKDVEQVIERAVTSVSEELPSYERLSDFLLTRESLPRTRLGKLQRHKLRERFERAGRQEQEPEAVPLSLDEMSAADQALLEDPAARQTWELLAEKYADRRLTPDDSLQLDLAVDSLEWMNLSLEIRRRAEAELDEEAIARIETVRDLLEEAVEASAGAGTQPDVSPLEDPEAALDESQRRYLRPHGRLTEFMARATLTVNRMLMRLVFRLEVEGAERVPDDVSLVITPNHLSYLDAPAIAAALPWRRLRTTYWGGWTGTMFANPLMRLLSRLMHVVPIDPQHGVMSSLAFGAAVLRRDRSLVWFPEGERSVDGQLHDFQPGIGMLLERYPAPVVPARIEGAHEALPPGRRLPRLCKIRVTFGEPLNVDTLREEGDEREAHEQISGSLYRAVASLKD